MKKATRNRHGLQVALRRNIHGSEGFRSELNYTCSLFFFQSDMLKKDDRKDDRAF